MDLRVLTIFQIVVNVILHCIGLYFLIILHNTVRNHENGKTLFERNVSNVGIVINFVLTVILILVLYAIHAIAIVTGNIIWSILLIFCTRIGYVCINKLLEALFNMIYRASYSSKALVFLVFSWLTSLVYCVGVVLSLDLKLHFLQSSVYFILTLDIIFIVVMPVCHTYLFILYKRSLSSSSSQLQDPGVCSFVRPCVSMCILLTFFIFTVVFVEVYSFETLIKLVVVATIESNICFLFCRTTFLACSLILFYCLIKVII